MGSETKVYTLAEVAPHNNAKDCWLVISDKVLIFLISVIYLYPSTFFCLLFSGVADFCVCLLKYMLKIQFLGLLLGETYSLFDICDYLLTFSLVG